MLGGQIRSDRSIWPFAYDQQLVVLIDEEQRPLTRRCLMPQPDHLPDIVELAPQLRVEA